MVKTTNQKHACTKESSWYKTRNTFGAARPTTILTKEAWPNRSNGPPCLKKVKREEGDGFVNDGSQEIGIYNADRSSRNLYGTQKKATHWPNPKAGPPSKAASALNWTATNSHRTEMGASIGTLEMLTLSHSGDKRITLPWPTSLQNTLAPS
jgi:hypothetical protein